MIVQEASGDITIKSIKGSTIEVYLKLSNATYVFRSVPSDVSKTFQIMIAKGAGFNALRYLQKHAGKGVRESMSDMNLAERILAGEKIDTVLGQDESKAIANPGKTVMVILTGEPMDDVKLTIKQAGIAGQVVDMGNVLGGNNIPSPEVPGSNIPGQTVPTGDPVVRPNNVPAPMTAVKTDTEIKMGDAKSTMAVRPAQFGQEPSVTGPVIQPGTPNYGTQSPRVIPSPAAPTSNIPGQSVDTGEPIVAIVGVPLDAVHIVKDQYPGARIMEEVDVAQEQFGASKLRCDNAKCDKNTSGMCQATNIHLSSMGVCQTQTKKSPPLYPKGQ